MSEEEYDEMPAVTQEMQELQEPQEPQEDTVPEGAAFVAELLKKSERAEWGGAERVLRLGVEVKAGGTTTMDVTLAASYATVRGPQENELLKTMHTYLGDFDRAADPLDLRLRSVVRLLSAWKETPGKSDEVPWWEAGPGAPREESPKYPHFAEFRELNQELVDTTITAIAGSFGVTLQQFMRCYEFVAHAGVPIFQGTTEEPIGLAFCAGLSWITRTTAHHPTPTAVVLTDGIRMVLVHLKDGKPGDPVIVPKAMMTHKVFSPPRQPGEPPELMLEALRTELFGTVKLTKGQSKTFRAACDVLRTVAELYEAPLPPRTEGEGMRLWTPDQWTQVVQAGKDIEKILEKPGVDQANPLHIVMMYHLIHALVSLDSVMIVHRSAQGAERRHWMTLMKEDRTRRLSGTEFQAAQTYMQCSVDLITRAMRLAKMHSYLPDQAHHRMAIFTAILNGSTRLCLMANHVSHLIDAFSCGPAFRKKMAVEVKGRQKKKK